MSAIGSKVTVKLTEFIEAIERKTKMRKAPNGSRSTGLREGAFIPAVGGFRVEMPGGHHFVWALEGQLSEEITFEPSNLVGVLKVLKTYQGKETSLDLTPSEKAFMIRCGSSKLTISRKN